MFYKIVHTEKADLPIIIEFFKEAIEYQKRNGYPIWPTIDLKAIESDISLKRQYKIVINDEIACVFSISESDKMIWRERDKDKAIYILRVVTNPNHKGKKQFAKALLWVNEYCQKNDIPLIRMDTWGDNQSIIDYYHSFGFKKVENYTTPNSEDIPVEQRNNYVILLELESKADLMLG